MQIEERIVDDVTVLDLKGKMTLGEGDELLKDKINSLVSQGHSKIVLNLEAVPYFAFFHGHIRFAGNIRLDVTDRDEGKSHSPSSKICRNGTLR